jgi:hypothetical protein
MNGRGDGIPAPSSGHKSTSHKCSFLVSRRSILARLGRVDVNSNKRPGEECVRPERAVPIDALLRVPLGERMFRVAIIHACWRGGRNRHTLDPAAACEPPIDRQPRGREAVNELGQSTHTARWAPPAWTVKGSAAQKFAGVDPDVVRAGHSCARRIERRRQVARSRRCRPAVAAAHFVWLRPDRVRGHLRRKARPCVDQLVDSRPNRTSGTALADANS